MSTVPPGPPTHASPPAREVSARPALSRVATWARLAIAALLTLGVLVILQFALTGARLDLTSNRLFTLSEGSRGVLRALDEPVDIRFYYSDEATAEIPLIRNYATRVRELLEEMAAVSGGKLRLQVIDPQPFSEEEDRASALGLTAVPLDGTGTGTGNVFFGISGSSATGAQAAIPFLQPDKEAFLEYDLVKLVHTLANPEKPVVGLITSLPMAAALDPGTRQVRQPWAVLAGWQELFDVRMIDVATSSGPSFRIDADIDTLIVVHPKSLPEDVLYAIDQFVLRGGRLLAFVDPYAELDAGEANPEDPMAAMMGDRSSDLAPLLAQWGVEFDPGKTVLDAQAALTVQSPGGGNVRHPAILGYGARQLNQDDVITANLAIINMASVGALTQRENAGSGSTSRLSPLIQSTPESMLVDTERLRMQPDPAALFDGFVASRVNHVLAARVEGRFATAFGTRTDEGHLSVSTQDSSIVIVADTDLLADRLWVQSQNFFQQTLMNAFANNGDFAINAVDNLNGSTDLIGVRGRAISARPFSRVEALRLTADDRFRQKEKELNAELVETERKLNELSGTRPDDAGIALSPAQNAEIERFQQQKLRIRKDLREVRRQLDADIESLGNRLKFLNIVLVPLAIGVAAFLFALWRRRGSRRLPVVAP